MDKDNNHALNTLRLLALACAAGWLCAACSGSKKTLPDPVLAQVDGKDIRLSELQRARFSLHEGIGAMPREDSAAQRSLKEELLDDLILEYVLLGEAERLGVQVSDAELTERVRTVWRTYKPGAEKTDEATLAAILESHRVDFLQWKADTRRRLRIEKLVQEAVLKKIEVPEEQISNYYQKHLDRFHLPPRVHAAQIVLGTREAGWKALQRLKAGEDFEELARSLSLAPEAAKGGDLGVFAEGDMPPEFDAIFALNSGQISDVVESPYGYHIFKLKRKIPATILSLKEVRDEIEKELREQGLAAAYQEWVEGLYRRTKIVKNTALLSRLNEIT